MQMEKYIYLFLQMTFNFYNVDIQSMMRPKQQNGVLKVKILVEETIAPLMQIVWQWEEQYAMLIQSVLELHGTNIY